MQVKYWTSTDSCLEKTDCLFWKYNCFSNV